MARKIQLKNKSGEILHPETEVSAITDLVANPGGSGLTELTSLKIGDTSYKVAANPDLSGYATTQYVDNRVNAVLGGEEIAEAYDTMKEIADYLDEHDDVIGDISNISNRVSLLTKVSILPMILTGQTAVYNGANEPYCNVYNIRFEPTLSEDNKLYFIIHLFNATDIATVKGYIRATRTEGIKVEILERHLIDSGSMSQSQLDALDIRVEWGYLNNSADPSVQVNMNINSVGRGAYYFTPRSLPTLDEIYAFEGNGNLITSSNISNYLPSVPTAVSQLTNDSGYLTSTALNGYALQANVPSALSDLNNDTGFITGSALENYALESYVDNAIGDLNIPSKVSDLTNDSGFITASSLSGLASETYVDNKFNNVPIPTLVSQLTNDMGYITSHQSLEAYATKNYVDTAVGNIDVPTKVSDLTNDAGYLTEHQSLAGLATESFVNTAIGNISIPTKTSDLTNDSGFLTQHQSLSGLATEQYVDNAIDEILGEGQIAANFDTIKEVADYLTQHGSDYTNLVAAVNGKADVEDIPTKVSDLQNDAGYLTQHQSLTGYATETYVNSAVGAITVPTKTSDLTNDSGFLTSHQSLAGLASESYVDTAVAGVVVPTKTSDLTNDSGFLTSHQSLSGLATETYVDEAIADINIPTKTSDLTNDSGFLTAHQSLANYALKSEIPEKVSDITNDTGFITASALQPYALAADVPTKVSDLVNDSGFLTSHQDISGKQDVLTAGTGISINANNVISVSGIQGISYEVISEFPQEGAAGKIYLKSKGGRTKDVYEEYIWVNNDFELIGSTAIDLSGYAQTANLATVATSGDYDDLINKPTIPSLSGYATTSYVDTAIAGIDTGVGLTINDLVGVYDEGTSGTDRIYIYQDGTFKFANPGAGDTWTGTGTYVFDGEQVTLGNYDNSNVAAYFEGATFDVVVDSSTERVKLINPSVAAMREPWYNKVPVYYNKEQSDAKYATVATLSDYATQTYVNNAIANIDNGSVEVLDIPDLSKLLGHYRQNTNTTSYGHSDYRISITSRSQPNENVLVKSILLTVYDNNGNEIINSDYGTSFHPQTPEAVDGTDWTDFGYLQGIDSSNNVFSFRVRKGQTDTTVNGENWGTGDVIILTNDTYGEFFYYSPLLIPEYTAGNGITISNGVISSSSSHVYTYEELAGHWDAIDSGHSGFYVDVNSDGTYAVYLAPYSLTAHGDITLNGASLTLSNTQEQAVASMLDGGSFALSITSDGKFQMINSNFGTYEKVIEPGIKEKFGEPDLTQDGTYVLKATVSNGAVTYSWVLEA